MPVLLLTLIMETVTSPLTLDQAFTEYTQVFLSARNLAHKTRIDYATDVTQLLTFLRDRGVTHVSQLDLSHLKPFLLTWMHWNYLAIPDGAKSPVANRSVPS